ncbi:hypothetical protein KM92DES2_20068 [uncultured Desulfovibrio sp.]|uniref:Uncharacterized protein n=1 Tax=uncultured Desulfovibrio sp. TaxID=167968 RepID=A0A212KIB2_9BACT|nr:hypothetical protein KM92DES2_20068 [uncultured Desulfovibrio sp.]
MLAAKIVRFSEERGEDRSTGSSGGDYICRLEPKNEYDHIKGSLSSTACAGKTAAYPER